MSLTITCANTAEATILRLSGRLTLGSATNNLRNSVQQNLAAARCELILDLADVSHIDSAGLGEIVFAGASAN
jgi:anti-sigma B factor antagonist